MFLIELFPGKKDSNDQPVYFFSKQVSMIRTGRQENHFLPSEKDIVALPEKVLNANFLE